MFELAAFALSWDPAIRGILATAVGVVVLCGSVYLLLGTNLGARLGFLMAMAGLFGWMAIMGTMWWVYGIGMVGRAPAWHVIEVVASAEADDLSAAATEEVRDVAELEALPAGDPVRGEAQAAADVALTEGQFAVFESTSDFLPIDAFETGGKDPDSLLSRLPLRHPPHFAVSQVQARIPVEVVLGQPVPPAEVDPSAPVYSVVMERDLGSLRVPPAMLTIGSTIIFLISVNALHRRDLEASRARAAVRAGRT
jgi:hypothetical protein